MNLMSKIDVSVVIAVRNEEKYVEEAVKSVLEQQGLQHEVIVIDDNSTDSTFNILESIAKNYSNLNLCKNPNAGKSKAFNLGVSLAKGDFVCLFAGDDIMPKDSLFERWKIIHTHTDSSNVVGLSKLICMSNDKKFDGQLVPKKRGVGGFTGTSYLIGRDALNKIFPVPESLPNEDSWMYYAVSMLPQVKIVHSDIVSNFWRVHEGNSINMMVDFKTYNSKITPRMRAPYLFLEKFKSELSQETQIRLQEEIKCEEKRLKGDFIGIMFTGLGLVEKLRFVSMSNNFFYNIRRRFFNFFSGW
jgi:glycosyltransferase involved in cell wall biosynthesis